MPNRIMEIQNRLQEKYDGEQRPAVSASLSRRRTWALSDQSFDIRFDVPLVPQQTGMSCWAAGAAMVVAWREKYSTDPSTIAQGAGEWASYSAGLNPESTTIFPIWGLTPEPQQSYSVDAFRQLLETYGPLWVAGAVPGPHIRVVIGMYGDGTPDGTKVLINDPWQKGMNVFSLPNAGAQYEETYSQFVTETERLARREAVGFPRAIYVARSTRPRTAGAQSRRPRAFSYSPSARRIYPLVPSYSARAFSLPVDFDVPRPLAPVKQPSPNSGWAAATAMLLAYKEGKTVTVEEAVRRAGSRYEELLRGDSPLPRAEMAAYLTALGLSSEPAPELTVEQMQGMLRRFGPVWLTPDYEAAASPEARVVTGIHGDGSPGGTTLTILDPAAGAETRLQFDRVLSVFQRLAGSALPGRMVAIYWPPDTLGNIPVTGQIPASGHPANGNGGGVIANRQSAPSAQSLSRRGAVRSYTYESPSLFTQQQSAWSYAQNPAPFMIAGLAVKEAIDIGLAATSVAQAQASMSQGGFSLSYDRAQRLLTSEARALMPGAKLPKTKYRYELFSLSMAWYDRINAANAKIYIEWEGNPYGEMSTVVIERDLSESSDFSRSSANINIILVNKIPLPGTDPRTWPLSFRYQGRYDPYGNGDYEFGGEFEIDAFGNLRFSKHEVVSRSALEFMIIGSPEDAVARGGSIFWMPVLPIPPDQINYLKTRLP
jgi:hypothetical protein